MLAATNFGAATSHDGGRTWTWLCPGVVSLAFTTEDPLTAISGEGTLFVGDSAGVFRSEDGCGWPRTIAEAGAPTASAGAILASVDRLYAGTSTDGAANALLRSLDDGRTWTPILGPTFGVWIESIAIAPSDPMRLYAVANRPPIRTEPWEVTVLRSDDGGGAWTSATFSNLAHEWRLYLVGVDPTDPDRIVGRTRNLYSGESDRIVLSEDGGASWAEVAVLDEVVAGAWAADGTVYVAGPLEGLSRSDDGGRSFHPARPELSLRCSVARGGEIWVCADDALDGFAIGRSIDRGETFEPVAHLRSITGLTSCGTGTDYADRCPAEEAMLASIVAGAPIPDAGAPDAGTGAGSALAPSPGCGCGIGARPGVSVGAALLLLVLARSARR